ncbi:MAG TPA: methionine--tRNA ligase, partial [Candidatus Dependentiae bacterium]|nr:methionine--tRNA ligase [Candidatus Dependentiae bacterium]
MAEKSKYFVTTPIYYVTSGPHIGSLYSTLIADVAARYHALFGDNVFFLTGTDEHGQKVAQAAAKAGVEPKAFVDKVSDEYKKMWKLYDLNYTDFIRTTDERHKKAVYKWIETVEKKGDIYKAQYDGWYCVPDETFVTDQAVDGKAPLCPTCGRETIQLTEENYFFRLSAYQDRLLKFYKENPDFITPRERLNEVISFVESGLKDLSISRTTVSWAIPFPKDPAHRVYVWADALMNYATAVGYGDDSKTKEFNYWWPADLHIMGKEIVKFHAAYWPAFLMAADLPLPKRLLVHGWITADGKKMSKSLGNVVDPVPLAATYGIEPVKYYLLRQLPISQDGD